MFCQYCGKQINDDARFCQYCGRELDQRNTWQQSYSSGQSYAQYDRSRYQSAPDMNSVGFNVLSFFFPIIGLILFCIWHGTYPKKAHGVGVWSLIGVGVGIALSIIAFAMIMLFTAAGSGGTTFSMPSNQF